jgi:hypothetical protein
MIIAVSILVGCLMAWLLFRSFFDDLADLMECVQYWLTPDIISVFRGEGTEDRWAQMKLMLYVGLSVGSGFATYFGLQKLFG